MLSDCVHCGVAFDWNRTGPSSARPVTFKVVDQDNGLQYIQEILGLDPVTVAKLRNSHECFLCKGCCALLQRIASVEDELRRRKKDFFLKCKKGTYLYERLNVSKSWFGATSSTTVTENTQTFQSEPPTGRFQMIPKVICLTPTSTQQHSSNVFHDQLHEKIPASGVQSAWFWKVARAIKNRNYSTAFNTMVKSTTRAKKDFCHVATRILRSEMQAYFKSSEYTRQTLTMDLLKTFSWNDFFEETTQKLPFLLQLLDCITVPPTTAKKHRDQQGEVGTYAPELGLIISAILYMRKKRKFNFIQAVMCTQLYRAGCCREVHTLLHDAGLTLSVSGISKLMSRLMPDFDMQNKTLEDRRLAIPVCRIFPKESDETYTLLSESEDEAEERGGADEAQHMSEADEAEQMSEANEEEQGSEVDEAEQRSEADKAEQRSEADDAGHPGSENEAENDEDGNEAEKGIQNENDAKEQTVRRTRTQPNTGAAGNTVGLLKTDGVTANWTESVLLDLTKDISVGDMSSAFMSMDGVSDSCTEATIENTYKEVVLSEDDPVPYSVNMDLITTEDSTMQLVVTDDGTALDKDNMELVVSEDGTVISVVNLEDTGTAFDQLSQSEDCGSHDIYTLQGRNINNEEGGAKSTALSGQGIKRTDTEQDPTHLEESGTSNSNSSDVHARVKQRGEESATIGKQKKRKSDTSSDLQDIQIKKNKVSKASHSGQKLEKGKNPKGSQDRAMQEKVNKKKDSSTSKGSAKKSIMNKNKDAAKIQGSAEKANSKTSQERTNLHTGTENNDRSYASHKPHQSKTEFNRDIAALNREKRRRRRYKSMETAVDDVLAGRLISKAACAYGIKTSALAAEVVKRRRAIQNKEGMCSINITARQMRADKRNNKDSSTSQRSANTGISMTPQKSTSDYKVTANKCLCTSSDKPQQSKTETVRCSAVTKKQKTRQMKMKAAIDKVLAGCVIRKVSCAYGIKMSVLRAAANRRRAIQNQDEMCSTGEPSAAQVKANQHTGSENKDSNTSQGRAQKGKMNKKKDPSSIQGSPEKGNSTNLQERTNDNTGIDINDLSVASDEPQPTEAETPSDSAAPNRRKRKTEATVNKGLASSVRRKVIRTVKNSRKKTTLPSQTKSRVTLYANEEVILKKYLEYLKSHAFPVQLTWLNIIKFAASSIVQSSGKLENRNFDLVKGPSIGWCRQFLPRRSVEGFSQQELIYNFSTPTKQVETYFSILHSMIKDLGLEEYPDQIFNCGELSLGDLVNMQLTHGGQQLFADSSSSAEITGQATLQLAVSALGRVLVPFLVVQNTVARDHFSDTFTGGFMLQDSDTGCMDEELFNKWFNNVFQIYSHATRKKPVILLMSNRSSLPSPNLIQAAIRKNIHIFYTPPEVSHNLLPLNHSIFNLLRHHVKHSVAPSDFIDCKQLIIILKKAMSRVLVHDVKLAFSSTSIFEYVYNINAEKEAHRPIFVQTLASQGKKKERKKSSGSSALPVGKNVVFCSENISDVPSSLSRPVIVHTIIPNEDKRLTPTERELSTYSSVFPARKSCLPSVMHQQQQQQQPTVYLVGGKYMTPSECQQSSNTSKDPVGSWPFPITQNLELPLAGKKSVPSAINTTPLPRTALSDSVCGAMVPSMVAVTIKKPQGPTFLLIPPSSTREEPGTDRLHIPQVSREHNYNMHVDEESIKTEPEDTSKKAEKDKTMKEPQACPVALYVNSAHIE